MQNSFFARTNWLRGIAAVGIAVAAIGCNDGTTDLGLNGLNLGNVANGQVTAEAVNIVSVEEFADLSRGRVLAVVGDNFGTSSGVVAIGTTETTVDVWTNFYVETIIPESVSAGNVTIQMTTAQGVAGEVGFETEGGLDPIVLTLDPAAGCVSYWPFDGDVEDVLGKGDGTIEDGDPFDDERSGLIEGIPTIFMDWFQTIRQDIVNLGQSKAFDVTTDDSFTISFWIRPEPTLEAGSSMTLLHINSAPSCPADGTEIEFVALGLEPTGAFPGTIQVSIRNVEDEDGAPQDITLTTNSSVVSHRWYHVALVYDARATLDNTDPNIPAADKEDAFQLYINGDLRDSDDFNLLPDGLFYNVNGDNLDYLGEHACSSNGLNPYKGRFDEMAVYNRALDSDELAWRIADDEAGAAGTCR